MQSLLFLFTALLAAGLFFIKEKREQIEAELPRFVATIGWMNRWSPNEFQVLNGTINSFSS